MQKGVSARGEWQKQEFVIEYQEGNFPTQICLNVWGEDKVKDLGRFNIGDRVKISFNLSSREYNGRWYTDIRAWKVVKKDQNQPAAAAAAMTGQVPPFEPAAGGDEGSDLPF